MSQAIDVNLIAKTSPLSRADVLAPGSIDSKLATKLQGVMKHAKFFFPLLNTKFVGFPPPIPGPGGTGEGLMFIWRVVKIAIAI